MRQRLITLGLAAAALFLFYALFFPKPAPIEEHVPQPTSEESDTDGLLAAWRWLQASGIPVVSLRERYDHLNIAPLRGAAGGDVLLVTMPQRLWVAEREWQELDSWIARGNTAIIMAALDDTPTWELAIDDPVWLTQLSRATRLQFVVEPEKKTKAGNDTAAPTEPPTDTLAGGLSRLLNAERNTLTPRGQHPLLDGVERVQTISDLPASRFRMQMIDASIPLALAERSDTHEAALWIKSWGRGQLLVCAYASPFSNREIDQPGNARLFANIIAWALAPGGRVIFDDAHQGLVAFYDPKAFFADARLHRTLAWLLLLWLAFVLGPLPLRNAFALWQPVDEKRLVEASGRYFSAVVTRHDAALRLIENFFNDCRRRLGLAETGAPLWDWLGERSRVGRAELDELKGLYARAHASERVSLTRLLKLLSQMRGQVA